MAKRKLKLTEKIIILSTFFMAIFLVGFWLSLRRTGRKYVLPKDFTGWVCIQYSYPGANPLPSNEGYLEIQVPESGYVETSSKLEKGWGRDLFFWKEGNEVTPIPLYTESPEGTRMYIHGRDIRAYSHEDILADLPIGTDTTLWDGTELKRVSAGEVSYKPGEVSLEYFYVFKKPELLDVKIPPNPNRKALESMQDHMINTDTP